MGASRGNQKAERDKGGRVLQSQTERAGFFPFFFSSWGIWDFKSTNRPNYQIVQWGNTLFPQSCELFLGVFWVSQNWLLPCSSCAVHISREVCFDWIFVFDFYLFFPYLFIFSCWLYLQSLSKIGGMVISLLSSFERLFFGLSMPSLHLTNLVVSDSVPLMTHSLSFLPSFIQLSSTTFFFFFPSFLFLLIPPLNLSISLFSFLPFEQLYGRAISALKCLIIGLIISGLLHNGNATDDLSSIKPSNIRIDPI